MKFNSRFGLAKLDNKKKEKKKRKERNREGSVVEGIVKVLLGPYKT